MLKSSSFLINRIMMLNKLPLSPFSKNILLNPKNNLSDNDEGNKKISKFPRENRTYLKSSHNKEYSLKEALEIYSKLPKKNINEENSDKIDKIVDNFFQKKLISNNDIKFFFDNIPLYVKPKNKSNLIKLLKFIFECKNMKIKEKINSTKTLFENILKYMAIDKNLITILDINEIFIFGIEPKSDYFKISEFFEVLTEKCLKIRIKEFTMEENVDFINQNFNDFKKLMINFKNSEYIGIFLNHILVDVKNINDNIDDISIETRKQIIPKLRLLEFQEILFSCYENVDRDLLKYYEMNIWKINSLTKIFYSKSLRFPEEENKIKDEAEIIINFPFSTLFQLNDYEFFLTQEEIEKILKILDGNIKNLLVKMSKDNFKIKHLSDFIKKLSNAINITKTNLDINYVHYPNLIKFHNYIIDSLFFSFKFYLLNDTIHKIINFNQIISNERRFRGQFKMSHNGQFISNHLSVNLKTYSSIKLYLYQENKNLKQIFHLHHEILFNFLESLKNSHESHSKKYLFDIFSSFSYSFENNISSKKLDNFFVQNYSKISEAQYSNNLLFQEKLFYYLVKLGKKLPNYEKIFEDLLEKISQNPDLKYKILKRILMNLFKNDVKIEKFIQIFCKYHFIFYTVKGISLLDNFEMQKVIYHYRTYLLSLLNDHNNEIKSLEDELKKNVDQLKKILANRLWWDKFNFPFNKYSNTDILKYLTDNIDINAQFLPIVDNIYEADFSLKDNRFIQFIGPNETINQLDIFEIDLDNQMFTQEFKSKKNWFAEKNYKLICIPFHLVLKDINVIKNYC